MKTHCISIVILTFISSFFFFTRSLATDNSIPTVPAAPIVNNFKVIATAPDSHIFNELPPAWLSLPFILLLLMIATGPLLYAHFWHKNYAKIAIGLALLVIAYYVFRMHNLTRPFEALMEYLQFIALISALYVAAGGILIHIRQHAYPAVVNIGLLLTGAILANLIGTTGASMLLIRPYIRFNKSRSKIFHVIFFILIVSNIGGALTPIGDPPLFLGFLKGVPFFWTLKHNFAPWATILSFLVTIFYILDAKRTHPIITVSPIDYSQPFLMIQGKKNFIWLFFIVLAVFIDPHLFGWVPSLTFHGHHFSFARELILFTIAGLSYFFANAADLKANEFSIEPLREVVIIFIGIFGTMVPALSLISAYAQMPTISKLITPSSLYWVTGLFSSVLDNAPTYLNFLAASMASQGKTLLNPTDVTAYAQGSDVAYSILRLKAISIASVFFGSMTYIGNGPNFMVKSIAEHAGIRMPSFVAYTIRFALPILLPLLVLIWLVYFFFVHY